MIILHSFLQVSTGYFFFLDADLLNLIILNRTVMMDKSLPWLKMRAILKKRLQVVFGVLKSCVSKVLQKYAERDSFQLNCDNYGGSNKKLEQRDIIQLHIISGNNPLMTARKVQAEIGPRGDDVSLRTIQRGLVEAGCILKVP